MMAKLRGVAVTNPHISHIKEEGLGNQEQNSSAQ
jgi:hypothetical protein